MFLIAMTLCKVVTALQLVCYYSLALNYQHSFELFQQNCSNKLDLKESALGEMDSEREKCPPWWHLGSADRHRKCFPGPNLAGIGHYYPRLQTMLLECKCMTEEDGVLVVGACLYTCNAIQGSYPLPCSTSLLNNFTCEDLNRHGRLCGECKEGYAPPVYSYELKCVKCKNYHYNWVRYIAAAFLPLTLFFFVVTVFSISFTSPRVSGVVLVYQLLAHPIQLSVLKNLSDSRLLTINPTFVNILTSLAAVWNLDFFRVAYEPFCLHPNMSTLHTLALDYAIAFYPILLIMLTYALVTYHDRGFKLALCIWGPVRKLSIRLKQQWHIRTSLIDVFASFIFLSTARVLSTSFVILIPSCSYLFNNTGSTEGELTYVYNVFNAPNVLYFSWENLPFAGIAILVTLLLNLFPMILLFVYPFRCFQHLLNKYNLNSNSLRTFIEVFQGNFKNRTNSTRDFRFFSGVLLLLELVLCALFALTRSNYFYPTASVIVFVYLCTVASLQPYRRSSDNCITVSMMAALLTTYMGITLNIIINKSTPAVQNNGTEILVFISGALIGIGAVAPLLYILGLAGFLIWTKIFNSSRLTHHLQCNTCQ